MIPNKLTLLARPVLLPEAEIRQRAFGRAAVERWQTLYGMDFEALHDAAIPGPTHTITEGEVVATWPQVGPPVELATLDLTTLDAPSVNASADLFVEPPGPVNAIALTFRADLYGGIAHILDPWTWPASSWATSGGCCPTRMRSAPGRFCAFTIAVESPARPTGSPMRYAPRAPGDARGID